MLELLLKGVDGLKEDPDLFLQASVENGFSGVVHTSRDDDDEGFLGHFFVKNNQLTDLLRVLESGVYGEVH